MKISAPLTNVNLRYRSHSLPPVDIGHIHESEIIVKYTSSYPFIYNLCMGGSKAASGKFAGKMCVYEVIAYL